MGEATEAPFRERAAGMTPNNGMQWTALRAAADAER